MLVPKRLFTIFFLFPFTMSEEKKGRKATMFESTTPTTTTTIIAPFERTELLSSDNKIPNPQESPIDVSRDEIFLKRDHKYFLSTPNKVHGVRKFVLFRRGKILEDDCEDKIVQRNNELFGESKKGETNKLGDWNRVSQIVLQAGQSNRIRQYKSKIESARRELFYKEEESNDGQKEGKRSDYYTNQSNSSSKRCKDHLYNSNGRRASNEYSPSSRNNKASVNKRPSYLLRFDNKINSSYQNVSSNSGRIHSRANKISKSKTIRSANEDINFGPLALQVELNSHQMQNGHKELSNSTNEDWMGDVGDVNKSEMKSNGEGDSKSEDILARYPGQDDYITPSISVTGIFGKSADLPCQTPRTHPSDPPVLMLWYRNSDRKPVYSYDARNSGPPIHWRSPKMSPRSEFDARTSTLKVYGLTEADSGPYSCTAHYRKGPTLSASVILSIVVPPQKVWISSTDSLVSPGGKIGPIVEGGTLRISCSAQGGSPSPEITWWNGEEQIIAEEGDLNAKFDDIPSKKSKMSIEQYKHASDNTLMSDDPNAYVETEEHSKWSTIEVSQNDSKEIESEFDLSNLIFNESLVHNHDKNNNKKINGIKDNLSSTRKRKRFNLKLKSPFLLSRLPFRRRSVVSNKYFLKINSKSTQHLRRRRRKLIFLKSNYMEKPPVRPATGETQDILPKNSIVRNQFNNSDRKTTRPKFNLKSVKIWRRYPQESYLTKLTTNVSLMVNKTSAVSNGREKRSLSTSPNEQLKAASDSRTSVRMFHVGEKVVSNLVVEALGREDLNRVFTCRVSNSDLLEPIKEWAKLEMILNPLKLMIDSGDKPLKAGHNYTFDCLTKGDTPPVVLEWYLDGEQMEGHAVKISRHADVTVSSLTLKAEPQHNGVTLSCTFKPNHPRLKATKETLLLTVNYPPSVHLSPGRSIDISKIQEGDDVYFECQVFASPSATQINWYRQGVLIKHDSSVGRIISNRSLVLQDVTKESSGRYSCDAINKLGVGKSKEMSMVVRYSPRCDTQQWTERGASIGVKMTVPCALDSLPPPTEVIWTFNSTTGHTARIEKGHVRQKNPQTSMVVFVPRNKLDFGELHCWGKNEVGRQLEPCVFTVFPATVPDSVKNCRQKSTTSAMMNVKCNAGFSGGLNVSYLLELWQSSTTKEQDRTLAVNAIRKSSKESKVGNNDVTSDSKEDGSDKPKEYLNFTSEVPQFKLKGLLPGATFAGTVKACNAEGCSKPVSLQLVTPSDTMEKRTAAMKPPPSNSSDYTSMLPLIIGICVSTVLTILIIGTVVLIVTCRKKSNTNSDASNSVHEEELKTAPNLQSPSNRTTEEFSTSQIIGSSSIDKPGQFSVQISTGSKKQKTVSQSSDFDDINCGFSGNALLLIDKGKDEPYDYYQQNKVEFSSNNSDNSRRKYDPSLSSSHLQT